MRTAYEVQLDIDVLNAKLSSLNQELNGIKIAAWWRMNNFIGWRVPCPTSPVAASLRASTQQPSGSSKLKREFESIRKQLLKVIRTKPFNVALAIKLDRRYNEIFDKLIP